MSDSKEYILEAKWKSATYPLCVTPNTTLEQLKQQLQILTNVLPKNQKLMGISAKTPANTPLHKLKIKKNKFMMVGTAEAQLVIPEPELDDSVIDDLDVDYSYTTVELDEVNANPDHRRRLERAYCGLNINLISPLRPGKKLLVLDLDYTLFDMKSQAQDMMSLKRPFTDEFLTELYPKYDIVIWSQTSWRWLELKLTHLGLLTPNPNFSLAFVLDKTCMFKVTSVDHKRRERSHQVKALELIWKKFSHYDAKNTIHIDDLGSSNSFTTLNHKTF